MEWASFLCCGHQEHVVLNLLERWSKTMVTEVAEWVKTNHVDFYDCDNLQMYRKFLQDSISDELYERIKFATQGGAGV